MEQMINENTIYNAALYCRLSKDDEQAGESVSIGTQKMILEKFCKEHDFHVFDVYVDDGFSGLNFERPEFQRLLKDIEDGKINLVIAKDLSRLGRDYIQTGYYTEVYFQQRHVRYIAVNDGIDTNREDNDIAPFKNILNDMYAKDLSRTYNYYPIRQLPADPKATDYLIYTVSAFEHGRQDVIPYIFWGNNSEDAAMTTWFDRFCMSF